MSKKEDILSLMTVNLRQLFLKAEIQYDDLNEIAFRVNEPIIFYENGVEYFLKEHTGRTCNSEEAFVATKEMIREVLEYVSDYSMYAYENEIGQGFLTVRGGHRVGISGKAVLENNQLKTIKDISYLNIRVAHEMKGVASDLLPKLIEGNRVCNTLFISPPGFGKTTLMRDCIRQISDGFTDLSGKRTSIVDERGELAACYLGIPQNDVGMRTSVLDGCPKAVGLMMLIRSMSPEVIAMDEIGGEGDEKAIRYASTCGISVLASQHGADFMDVRGNVEFERYVLIEKDSKNRRVYHVKNGDRK